MRGLGPLAFAAAALAFAACGDRSTLLVQVIVLDAGRADAGEDAGTDGPTDAPPPPCVTDSDCDDHRYCTLSARCDPVMGCVRTPRTCDDSVDCTRDTCDETHRRCGHVLDDTMCPQDQLCSPTRGCASFVYGVAADLHLYEVGVPDGQLVDLGPSPAGASDIALASDGTLYSTDSYVLYVTDRTNATTRAVGSILPLHQYSGLGFGPDSSLDAVADVASVLAVDTTSAAARSVATLPAGYRASGDLTSLGGKLYVTLAPMGGGDAAPDSLGVIDLASGTTKVLGATGVACIWGLATLGGVVYGLTCNGTIVALDVASGAAKTLAQTQPAFYGGAGR